MCWDEGLDANIIIIGSVVFTDINVVQNIDWCLMLGTTCDSISLDSVTHIEWTVDKGSGVKEIS